MNFHTDSVNIDSRIHTEWTLDYIRNETKTENLYQWIEYELKIKRNPAFYGIYSLFIIIGILNDRLKFSS